MTDGLLIELRQKTVQLLEAIDSGSDGAWDYGEIVGHHPEGPDQIVPPPDSAPSELESQGADAKYSAENLGRADSARGEDHEAGIEAALEAFWPAIPVGRRHYLYARPMADAIAAYLARCSSPVDDTERGEDHEAIAAAYQRLQGKIIELGEENERLRDELTDAEYRRVQMQRVIEHAEDEAARLRSSPVDDTERLQRAIDVAYGAMNSSAYVGGPTEREAWQTALAALGEVVTQHKGQAALSVDAGKPDSDAR